MSIAHDIERAFLAGWRSQTLHRQEKEMRRHLSEQQIDCMVKDSFPASDPPSTY